MAGPAWCEETPADREVIAQNVAGLLRELAASSAGRRPPTLALAHEWHARIYSGVASVPAPTYLGAVRGTGELVGYDVVLRDRVTGRVTAAGVPAADVAAELARFESAIRTATRRLEAVIPAGSRAANRDEVLAVVELCAVVHGEWIRIHPYANGNGRTARTWANWIALRYGLPPFVRIKPRPDGLLYGRAAQASMGVGGVPDHDLTVQVFLDLLRTRP